MRRAINTINKEEYNQLLKEAAQRMGKTFFRLCEEEGMKMRDADDKGNFDRAEKHDFNARALRCMADIYYDIFKLNKIDNNVNLNKVWHTMDELQDGKRQYIVQYNEDGKFAMFTKPIPVPKEQAKSVFKRWAYMDDLIPDTED